jgi:acetyltransferase-like isoleucine patch superfamily enzyme
MLNNIMINLRYDLPVFYILLITNILPDNVVFLRLRGFLVSLFLKNCGKNLRLGRDITLYNSSMIEFGNDVYIAKGNWFSAGELIKIGNSVMFGPYNVVASANHSLENGSYRYGITKKKKIIVHDGSWITSNCTITAGSIIGKSCLITPNSTVKGIISDNTKL